MLDIDFERRPVEHRLQLHALIVDIGPGQPRRSDYTWEVIGTPEAIADMLRTKWPDFQTRLTADLRCRRIAHAGDGVPGGFRG